VDGVSFAVQRGEVFALLGPNGAGKSTVVRMLCGILQPDEGRLRFDLGAGETDRADPARVGYLPEDRGLYADAKVLPMIVYLASLRGLERAEAARRARTWRERFDLGARANDRVDALSKGNQQKVQLIASLVHEPTLAILDEPFSGFDPVNQDLVSRLILELRDGGTTVVLSAHHMDLVEALADRMLLLHQGREVLSGTLEEVRAASGVARRLRVTLAVPAPDDLLTGVATGPVVHRDGGRVLEVDLPDGMAVGSVLHAITARAEVVDVHSEAPSLRALYLRAVGVDPEADPVDAEVRS
jgi:ABC-2 type transport system ATP-binding protein